MKDISVSVATTGLIQAANIATGLIAARLLLPEGRGELAVIMLWPGLLAELGALGLYDALLYRSATAAAAPRRIFATMLWLGAALSLALIGIGAVILPIVMAADSQSLQNIAFAYMCAFLPAYFAALYIGAMFQGHLDMVTWNIVRVMVPVGYLAAILAMWADGRAELGGFATAYIIGHGLCILVGLVLLARRGWLGIVPDIAIGRGLLTYGIKVHVGDIMSALRQRLDQALVALLLPNVDLGHYVVALTVANGPLILVFTIANVAFPKISQQTTHEGKLVVFGRYLRVCLALAFAATLSLIVLSYWLIPLLFGEPFTPSVPIAQVLLLGMIPFAAKSMLADALKAWDRSLAIGRAEIVGLVTAVIALAVLLPTLGIIGAAWSLVATHVATAIAMALSLRHKLGIAVLPLLRPTPADWQLALSLVRGGRG
jgi:O-antigen/teichoic acid export membrane protein